MAFDKKISNADSVGRSKNATQNIVHVRTNRKSPFLAPSRERKFIRSKASVNRFYPALKTGGFNSPTFSFFSFVFTFAGKLIFCLSLLSP